MATYFELATAGGSATDSQAEQLVWTSAEDTTTVRASVNPWLTELGSVSPQAIDLVRIATAALIADRRSPRPAGWSREIRLRVHAVEPAKWIDAVETVSALLQFLSGDIWDVELVVDSSSAPEDKDGEDKDDRATPSLDAATLFSGGLDSFCGALVAAGAGRSYLYVSQRDNPTVAGSQNRARDWLRTSLDDTFDPLAITLAQAQLTKVRDPNSRSRSLLFLALGFAAAESANLPRLVVPENCFTSLNPPLRADRTGSLSTRSTHPYTFALLNLLREQLGMSVEVENPFAWLTKGELVAKAASSSSAASVGIATTLSCAKLDGRVYKGGNQNWNCGLCVACIIRRAAIAAAGLDDQTPYVATKVKKSVLKELVERRRSDIQAVKRALAVGVSEDALISDTEFPVDFDIDQALDLWQRALKEIALVSLP
jgi:hypothetical protein